MLEKKNRYLKSWKGSLWLMWLTRWGDKKRKSRRGGEKRQEKKTGAQRWAHSREVSQYFFTATLSPLNPLPSTLKIGTNLLTLIPAASAGLDSFHSRSSRGEEESKRWQRIEGGEGRERQSERATKERVRREREKDLYLCPSWQTIVFTIFFSQSNKGRAVIASD